MPQGPASRSAPTPQRLLLAATMRDEGPFILEWVAHHLAVGFTEIVVCTNDCVDGSPDLLDSLAALAPLTHLRTAVAPGAKAQLAAYAQAEALAGIRDADWAMVLDADEFLNIHVDDGTLGALIDAVPEATAFLVNWRIFGNAGHEAFRPGLVAERFCQAARRDDPVNLSFKTLFRHPRAYHCMLMPHQPRYPRPAALGDLLYVDGAGRRVPDYFSDESRDSFLQSEPGSVRWTLAQVNHYNTRSREDYLVKHARGGGLDIAWDRDESWATFNKNDERDVTIARMAPAAAAIRARFLRDDAVRSCHERCCRLYADHVARLRRG